MSKVLILKGRVLEYCTRNPLYAIISDMKRKSLVGKKFGRLIVIDFAPDRISTKGHRRYYWLCQCDCGTIKEVYAPNLIGGSSTSCGCRHKEIMHKMSGVNSPTWKGGRRIDEQGYVNIYQPNHRKAKSNGYVKEHVLVMEGEVGRPLLTGENVHHKNGIKSDNRLSNLELWSSSQPSGQRIQDKVVWAKEILALYA
jgi:hypothetical protein